MGFYSQYLLLCVLEITGQELYMWAFTPRTDQSYLCPCTEALIQPGVTEYADFKPSE